MYYASFSLLRALITILQLPFTSHCKKSRTLISQVHKEININTDWRCGLPLPGCITLSADIRVVPTLSTGEDQSSGVPAHGAPFSFQTKASPTSPLNQEVCSRPLVQSNECWTVLDPHPCLDSLVTCSKQSNVSPSQPFAWALSHPSSSPSQRVFS